jgi:hypothetical protein
VIDALLAARVHDAREADTAIKLWGELVSRHKPGAEWRPLSPAEEAAIRAELELVASIARKLLNALSAAKARRPAHFYVVEEDGR